MRTYFLEGLQELELLGVGGTFVEDGLWLRELVGRTVLLFLLGVFLDLPQWLACVLYFLGIGSKTLDDVLDLGIGFLILPTVLVGPLGGEEWLCGFDGVFPELQFVLLGVVGGSLLVERQGVRQVDRCSVVELGVFFYSRLFVDGLECSHAAQSLIEVDVCLSVGQADYDLVDGGAPAESVDGAGSDSKGFHSFECGSIVEVEVAEFLICLLPDGGAQEKVLVIGTEAHFVAWKSVEETSLMQDRSIEHADVPYFQSAIGVSGGQSATVLEGDNRCEVFLAIVSLPDHHFWSVEVIFGAEYLE